jgi:hypothetical protein
MKNITPGEVTVAKVRAIVRAKDAPEALKIIIPSATGKVKSQLIDPANSTYIFVELSPVQSSLVEQQAEMEHKFTLLAEQWHRETRLLSSVAKMAMHPAYQKIIGMGRAALPFILRDLEETRDHWLWALHAITDEDPAPDDSDYDAAVDAWLAWGRKRGYLK